MAFIEIRNDKWYGQDDYAPQLFEDRYCREILNTDYLVHIYVVLPDNTDICYEYMNAKGKRFEMYETFESVGECSTRFNEIARILKEEK